MHRMIRILLLTATALVLTQTAAAQTQRRGPSTRIRGGVLQRPDTLHRPVDSLRTILIADSLHAAAESIRNRIDSLRGLSIDTPSTDLPDSLPADISALSPADTLPKSTVADSLLFDAAALDSLAHSLASRADSLRLSLLPLEDSLPRLDSLAIDTLVAQLPFPPLVDTTRHSRRGKFFSDSMSLSKVCWTAAVLPGYGQIYNKQYWKLPVFYGILGTSIGLFIHENNKYKPLKRQYDAITDVSTVRSEALDNLQAQMIRSNTRRQVYLFTALGSYLYFIGDAAVNYSTNDVSRVKKATTLACICPGAGQIYNKSYWKVPFVVGGFASMIYCIDWNNRGYQRFRKAYNLRVAYDDELKQWQDGDQTTDRPSPKDEFRGRYQSSFLKNLKDNYRRNRDLCIIITAGLYVLQIVDAHVDAHLKDYDISDDLSLNIEPKIDYTYIPTAGGNRPVYGFNVSLNF